MLADKSRLRAEIYVDDPAYVVRASAAQAAVEVAVAICWAMIAGFPLSWGKSEGGQHIKWIGVNYHVQSSPEVVVTVSIPDDKVESARSFCASSLDRNYILVSDLRKGAGLLQFIASVVPTIKPCYSGRLAC